MTVGSRYTREIKDQDALLQEPVCVNRLWVDEPACVIGQPTLERLAVWEGQAAYEAAVKALTSINAMLTELDAQDAAPTPASAAHDTPGPATHDANALSGELSAETIEAVEAMWSEADEPEPPISIPPAVESLAFMEDELRRQAAGNRTEAAPEMIEAEVKDDRASATPFVGASSRHHPAPHPRLVFGQPLPAPQRGSARTRQRSNGQQLDVFSTLEAARQAPSSLTTERAQDQTLADPSAMEQRSLFD